MVLSLDPLKSKFGLSGDVDNDVTYSPQHNYNTLSYLCYPSSMSIQLPSKIHYFAHFDSNLISFQKIFKEREKTCVNNKREPILKNNKPINRKKMIIGKDLNGIYLMIMDIITYNKVFKNTSSKIC